MAVLMCKDLWQNHSVGGDTGVGALISERMWIIEKNEN